MSGRRRNSVNSMLRNTSCWHRTQRMVHEDQSSPPNTSLAKCGHIHFYYISTDRTDWVAADLIAEREHRRVVSHEASRRLARTVFVFKERWLSVQPRRTGIECIWRADSMLVTSQRFPSERASYLTAVRSSLRRTKSCRVRRGWTPRYPFVVGRSGSSGCPSP